MNKYRLYIAYKDINYHLERLDMKEGYKEYCYSMDVETKTPVTKRYVKKIFNGCKIDNIKITALIFNDTIYVREGVLQISDGYKMFFINDFNKIVKIEE